MIAMRLIIALLGTVLIQCAKAQDTCTEPDWCKTFALYCVDPQFQAQMEASCKITCKTCPFSQPTDDRCIENNGGCQHKCSIGTESNAVECSCFAGFELQLNNRSCGDVNECSQSADPCAEHTSRPFCVNQRGSFFCTNNNCAETAGYLNRYQRTECCRALTNYSCGRERFPGRIVGGKPSVAARWPWMVHILVDGAVLCGGTLIEPNWVVTAGHCFLRSNVTKSVKLTFGALRPQDRSTHVQKRDGVEIVFYPDWDRNRFPYNDIALVRLDHPVEYGEFAHPACLPNGERPKTGTTCWAVGYGTVEYRGKAADSLQEVDLPVVDTGRCKPVYSGTQYPVDENIMFCAGHELGGKDACQGDSGGPLICQRCSSCQWYLAGITSFGKGCARPGVYGVYTDVEKFEEWISSRTNVPVNKNKICGQENAIRWSSWSLWTSCSATCGGGVQSQSRTCVRGRPGTGGCIGSSTRNRTCADSSCPVWSAYGSWSSCSVSCGGGQRNHTRQCIGGNAGDPGCEGSNVEVEQCNEHICPSWEQWSQWSSCPVTCGGGKERSQRTCNTGGMAGLSCPGKSDRTRDCNRQDCPMWDTYGSWTACSVSCGGGQRNRRRQCIGGDVGDLGCEGSDVSVENCNQHPCPEWRPWATWSDCSVTCGGGKERSTRTCDNGGVADSTCVGKNSRERDCNAQTCPVWQTWGQWSACTKTCQGGKSTRRRTCANGSPGEVGCHVGVATENKDCNTEPCGSWTTWREVSSCSATCGGAEKTERRNCPGGTAGTGGCPGSATRVVACATEECPFWQNWSRFSKCSVSCGGGTKMRTRTCVNGSPGDDGCPRPAKTIINCNTEPCPVWTDWTDWSPCTASCGGGRRGSSRSCTYGTIGDAGCEGKSTRTEICESQNCPRWSNYGQWSTCSKSCGGGQKTRTRRCLDGTPGQTGCHVGSTTDVMDCGQNNCPMWSGWDSWTDCSQTCGGGSRSRSRTCRYGSSVSDCVGSASENENCNTQSCPPKHEDWSTWGACPVTCGGGTKRRSRKCVEYCENDIEETQQCNINACPVLVDWTQWSQCSVSCGPGSRGRTRQCTGTDNPGDCNAQLSDSKACYPACVSDWSEFGPCSVKCGIDGKKTRTRQCISSRSDNSECTGPFEDQQPCGEPCPSTWGSWAQWSTCSHDCNGGLRTRARSCVGGPVGVGGCAPAGRATSTELCNSQPCSTVCKDLDPRCEHWYYTFFDLCSRPNNFTKKNCKGTCGFCGPPGSWTQWSDCTARCEGGVQTRSRTCSNEFGCNGATNNARACNQQPCEGFTQWSPWGPCTESCVGGSRSRSRYCPPGTNCPPDQHGSETEQTETCNQHPCPGVWAPWSAWTQCSKTCGPGVQQRNRACMGGVKDDPGCTEHDQESQSCEIEVCPGAWDPWENVGTCSAQCGPGTQAQRRTCVGGVTGGPGCPGTDTRNIDCNLTPCVTRWLAWGNWGSCSKQCGNGKLTRERQCENGSPGDSGCPGDDFETKPCNTQACATGPCGALRDVIPCASLKTSCEVLIDYMRRNCAKTCCEERNKAPAVLCQDTPLYHPTCLSWMFLCHSPQGAWMNTHCQKTCRLC